MSSQHVQRMDSTQKIRRSVFAQFATTPELECCICIRMHTAAYGNAYVALCISQYLRIQHVSLKHGAIQLNPHHVHEGRSTEDKNLLMGYNVNV